MVRNRGKYFVKISILAFALFRLCLGSGLSQTADQYFELGKKDLAVHSLPAAHAHFQLALSVDPNHEGANCFYAVTSILMISNGAEVVKHVRVVATSASGVPSQFIFCWPRRSGSPLACS